MEEVLKTLIRRVLGARPAEAPPEAAPASGADGAAWCGRAAFSCATPSRGAAPRC